MPTYEYECEKCHRVFEVRQRISEPALTTCDECGGAIHRLLSPAPFILKGGGWYVTDYPSEARKKGVVADKPSGDKPSGDKPSAEKAAPAKADSPSTAPSAGASSSTPAPAD